MIARNDRRKIVLTVAIGLCEAIQTRAISIDEASHYLFSPHTMKVFDDDPEVKEIILLATEFEDIAALVPGSLADAVADVRQRAIAALAQMPGCDFQEPHWLSCLITK